MGDRYFLKQGTFFKPEPDYELTLIEAEAIEAAEREYQVDALRQVKRGATWSRAMCLSTTWSAASSWSAT